MPRGPPDHGRPIYVLRSMRAARLRGLGRLIQRLASRVVTDRHSRCRNAARLATVRDFSVDRTDRAGVVNLGHREAIPAVPNDAPVLEHDPDGSNGTRASGCTPTSPPWSSGTRLAQHPDMPRSVEMLTTPRRRSSIRPMWQPVPTSYRRSIKHPPSDGGHHEQPPECCGH